MSIGPSLPPHLTGKRARSSSSSSESGHSPPPSQIGPIFPVPVSDPEQEQPSEKRRRLSNDPKPANIGPALPPTEPPITPDDDEDSEDDFGPSLPSADGAVDEPVHTQPSASPLTRNEPSTSTAKREDWMLAPPSGSSLSSLSGPLKARGFATGKAAARAASTSENTWTETMEQKQARLRSEILGTNDKSSRGERKGDKEKMEDEERRARRDREMRERVKAYENGEGGKKSLYEGRKKGRDEDDDPSKRAFDREKDIGSGGLGRKERMAFVDSAKGFGGRFSTGKFL